MPYAPSCSNQTRLSGHRVVQDVVRGFEALDRVGEGHGWQNEPQIDCRVGVRFCLILHEDGKNLSYAPVSQIGPIRAYPASHTMRCADTRRRIGRGRDMSGRTSLRLIVVWLGVSPYFARRWKNLSYGPRRSNCTDSSKHRSAHDAARRFEAPGWAGEELAGRTSHQIDC